MSRHLPLLYRVAVLAAGAAAWLAAAAPPASACSICRCGDPTFNALGSNVYASSGEFRLALDWERFSKTQRIFENGRRGTDAEVENRYTATLSYAFAERFLLVGRIPLSHRDLTTTFADESARVRTTGISDPEFYGLVRLWSSDFGPGLGRRSWLSAILGVKTPWGRNDVRENGERVDEHAQSGTGSTDVFGGLSVFYLLDMNSSLFGSAQYRGTGRNDFGYKYGNITTASLAYEHKLSEVLDAVAEFDFRHSGRDEVAASGELDRDTGGTILYVTPRLLASVAKGVVLRVSAQIPVVTNLYGVQNEKANYNAGLTFLF